MFTFHHLADIDAATWLTLLNNHDVHRHMPLAGASWTTEAATDWARGKDDQWTTNGSGPWALRVDDRFAGWGGFQKVGADADLALVMLPEFWGCGRQAHDAMVDKGFAELGLSSITILLPPSRVRLKGLARLGYLRRAKPSMVGTDFSSFGWPKRVAYEGHEYPPLAP